LLADQSKNIANYHSVMKYYQIKKGWQTGNENISYIFWLGGEYMNQ